MARVAAQYAYMVSSDFESPEARYALGPYTPVDPTCYLCGLVAGDSCTVHVHVCMCSSLTGDLPSVRSCRQGLVFVHVCMYIVSP